MPSPFTLAALAASAVPAFEVAGVQPLGGPGDGHCHAALLLDAYGDAAVVRTPAVAAGAARLRSEAVALGAFTPGVRARLPFSVPALRGRQDGAQPVVVTDWVPGRALRPSDVRPDSALAASLGAGIAALHALPTGIAEGRLAHRDAETARREAGDLVDGQAAHLPEVVARRWREAIAHAPMWRYRPVVVHGSLGPEDLLVDRERLKGLLGWSGLHVGDPAADLAWALSLPARGAADAVFSAYSGAAAAQPDAQLRQRATLLAELELAKWRRFAAATGDAALVDDAAALLAALADRLDKSRDPSLIGEPAAVLSLHEVERMLAGHAARSLSAADHRSSSSASDGNTAGSMMRSAAT